MTVSMGQLDSLVGTTFSINAFASVAFGSETTAPTTNGGPIAAGVTGTLTGAGTVTAVSASVTTVDDTANTVTVTYSTQSGGSSVLTWYVIGTNSNSLLLSAANSGAVAAIANGGSASAFNLQALSSANADLVHGGVGTSQTWSAFLTPISVASATAAYHAGTLSSWTAIADSAANVGNSIDLLSQMVINGQLGLVTLTDGGTPSIVLTEQQLGDDGAGLAVIGGSYRLFVTATAAGDVAAVIGGSAVPAIVAIADSADNVGANLDSLESYAARGQIASIALTDSGTPTITLTEAQFNGDSAVLGAMVGSYQLAVTGAGAAEIAGFFARTAAVTSVAVTDSAANVGANLDTLAIYAAKGEIVTIDLTDSGTPTITLTEAQYTRDVSVLAKIESSCQLAVTNVRAADAPSLIDHDVSIATVAIADSAAAVNANLDALNNYASNGEIASITLTGSGTQTLTVTETQLGNDNAVLAAIVGPYHLAVTGVAAADLNGIFTGAVPVTSVAIVDSSANVSDSLDSIESYAAKGEVASIALTDSATPAMTMAEKQFVSDAAALKAITSPYHLILTGALAADVAGIFTGNSAVTSVAVTDSAANVGANLNALETYLAKGEISSITLTDSGIPILPVTAAQLGADQLVLADIPGLFTLAVSAPATSTSITGLPGYGTAVVFTGPAAAYSVTPTGNGVSFSISNGILNNQLSGITALQFSDHTEFVASLTPTGGGVVSSAQVANLYAAVFARTPDIAGLAYYEAMAVSTPALPIINYAADFLSSSEYTANSAHNYAQTTAGDTQFITDTYNNLLHRAPAATDAAWYEANVMQFYLTGQTPGTAAYATAELLAHAAVLADFSQSPEFLGDVQVTALHPADAQHWLVLI